MAAALGCSFLCLALPVLGQQTVATVYRGSVGGSHFQMLLNIQGNSASGAYSYDSIGEDLKLTGHLDGQGRLELAESGAKGKPTGKFVCKRFDHAAVTISGIELAEKIKKGQFKTSKFGSRNASISELWSAALAA